MKVVFLDIDGVLNTSNNQSFGCDGIFSKAACKNLNLLLDKEQKLKIVVSSSWRLIGETKVKKVLKKNGIDTNKIIGITGREPGNRGNQIQCWLNRNPEVTNFVIIDDDSDMDHLSYKLVKTNPFIGITEKDVEKAIEILSEKKYV